MKKILSLFFALVAISFSAFSQGAPGSGTVINSNGNVVVTITYVDSLAGTSGTLTVTTDANGAFQVLIPFTQNPTGGISLSAWACITNCNGQTVCDMANFVPGTIMVFELNFCGGILSDADGDGFDASVDCDDNNVWAYPGAFEECNNWIDNNCNGIVDEGCNGDSTFVDTDGDGYPAFADCNDNNPWVNPGAIEECNNGVDNNCDGTIDEGCNGDSTAVDYDNDGYNSLVDCDDNNAWAYPGALEQCNDWIDNNCNGLVDEGCNGDSTFVDTDGDGYPVFADCNDNNPWVNPGAVEECNNGIDNDCDGMIDEDCGGTTGCTADIILMTDSMLNGAGNAFEVWVINSTDPAGTTFTWTTGDGATLSGPYPTYTYSELGTYTLCLYMTNSAGCVDTACVTFTVNPDGSVSPGGALQQTFTLNVSAAGPVSVEELNIINGLEVYPNPAEEQTILSWNSSRSENGTIMIYGMNGQLIQTMNYQSIVGKNQMIVNTNQWNSGLYQIMMISKEGVKRNIQVVK